uniref:Ribonuclease E n=1 Tax=Scinaia undulata TaxID=1884664 RepID=A0A1G4NXB6_9FLOR|nr:Ribonuclease E [Scinaia undulata]SCW23298.1 Ribonuclease E [Scinaia undulata]
MIRKIIISHLNNAAALVQNNKIQELIIVNNTYQVNDIYVGTVEKIFTSINAAFINLHCNQKSGFMHISDIKNGNKITFINSRNIINNLTIRQKLLVQITKEPSSSKGPRLTTNLCLCGRYIVLMPFNNTICISHKIYDENERIFLRSLGLLIKPSTIGILFKESSIGIRDEVIINDLRNLRKQWHFIQKAIIDQECPSILYEDTDIIKKIIRDFLKQDVECIITDSKESLKQLHEYIQIPHGNRQKSALQLYQSSICILHKFGIHSTIFSALENKINLKSGIHIFIESSEALTVVDVNSGSFNKAHSPSDSLLRTNCLAASEIAHQLKIRNINGIIIIDFIDMRTHKDQLKLLEHFNKLLRSDDAKPEIIQLSELGLVEITRRRRGKSLQEIFKGTYQKIDKAKKEKLLNSCKISSSIEDNKAININNIFFKKKFKQNLKIRNNRSSKHSIKFLPLKCSYIIPIDLYYLTIDHAKAGQKQSQKKA